jgi:sporulation protein YlmC with PRC-barrel domain
MTKRLALAAMAAALLTTTALAQSAPPASSTAPAMKPAQSTAAPAMIQTNAVGKWRTSKLVGLNVYNAANEKIGDISELITDSSGKIDAIVVGVGGFLGIGEHNVGLPFSQVKFVMEPVRTSSTTATTTATTGAGTATTTTTNADATKDFPDHAMVNMTKDQLKAMPAFKYASDTSSASMTTTTRPAPAPAPATTPAR